MVLEMSMEQMLNSTETLNMSPLHNDIVPDELKTLFKRAATHGKLTQALYELKELGYNFCFMECVWVDKVKSLRLL